MDSSSDDDDVSGGDGGERPAKKARVGDGRAAEVGSSEELKCWQTEQLARGILDNTLNRMLEHSGQAPDNPVNEVAVEHEAVLMAIQSHGLQRFQQPVEREPSPPPLAYPSSSSSSGDNTVFGRLEHDSFLDAAVAVAIQKKGLSVFTSANSV
ncbi:uncharacterized protein LOC132199243 [Neocloeon triangulifer]|uniref:uncharacterized protein LOC132199243 n=1 Tax=Neocloeon triangulifer TaxID=2078957 RepID=UPI00286F1DDF|nr:uncharacterized protein LOC132199243 [Neocloeon triangulifer]